MWVAVVVVLELAETRALGLVQEGLPEPVATSVTAVLLFETGDEELIATVVLSCLENSGVVALGLGLKLGGWSGCCQVDGGEQGRERSGEEVEFDHGDWLLGGPSLTGYKLEQNRP